MSRKTILQLDKCARIAAAAMALGTLALPLLLPLDGKPHSDFMVLVGRLHPLILHTPIALLALVPLFEIAGHKPHRRHLRDFAGICLTIGGAGALFAAITGFLLAYGSGMNDATVKGHMWGGIALSTITIATLLIRRWWTHGKLKFIYPAMLVAIFTTLGWAAHQGGSITHGETYLTDPLPPSIKKVMGIKQKAASVEAPPDSAFAVNIMPIFEKRCVSCHNANKIKGDLRLDGYSQLMAGGKSGPSVVAGAPEKSELVRRIKLPMGHTQVMPPEGKPLLDEADTKVIHDWIAAGASLTTPPFANAVKKIVHPAAQDYTPKLAEILKLEKATSVKVTPVSQNPGDGLILRTRAVAATFDDAMLARFAPLADSIVEVELEDTKVTDACFATLAKFRHLRTVHLERTAVTGKGMAQLAGLKKLYHLNLTSTKVTAENLKSVKKVPRVYTYDTPATPPQTVPTAIQQPVSPPAPASTQDPMNKN